MPRPLLTLALLFLVMSLAAAMTTHADERTASDTSDRSEAGAAIFRVELRSWVVAGHGRHLFAEITAPPGFEHLSTVVEYTATWDRFDYERPTEPARDGLIAKMTRGERLRPVLNIVPDNRLEAEYEITLAQALELQKDRLFEKPYFLTGPNSTSGLRAAFRAADLEFPEHVIAGGRLLGQFPGAQFSPGDEIPHDEWPLHGLPQGPEPPPSAALGAEAAQRSRRIRPRRSAPRLLRRVLRLAPLRPAHRPLVPKA